MVGHDQERARRAGCAPPPSTSTSRKKTPTSTRASARGHVVEQTRADARRHASARGRAASASARRGARPSSTSTNASRTPPTTKNTMRDRMARRLEPVARDHAAKTAGPRMPANFSNTPKNAKNSDDAWRGIMVAKSERLRRLAAALHGAHQEGQHEEVGGRLHAVAEDRDHEVHGERDEDRPLGADPAGQAPKRNANGMPDELDHEDGRRSGALSRCPSRAVGRGHADDGLDAVVVERGRRAGTGRPAGSRAAPAGCSPRRAKPAAITAPDRGRRPARAPRAARGRGGTAGSRTPPTRRRR